MTNPYWETIHTVYDSSLGSAKAFTKGNSSCEFIYKKNLLGKRGLHCSDLPSFTVTMVPTGLIDYLLIKSRIGEIYFLNHNLDS